MSLEQTTQELKAQVTKMNFHDDNTAIRQAGITPIQQHSKKKVTVYLTKDEYDMFTEMWLEKAAITGKSDKSRLMGDIVRAFYASRRN